MFRFSKEIDGMKRKWYIQTGIAVMIILLWSVPQKVYAGDLNAEEQNLLAMMEESIEYQGVVYVVAPGYIAQARDYFSQDDVDLTAEQAQEVIASVYASIEAGIAEGYIIPRIVEQPEDPPEKEENTEPVNEAGGGNASEPADRSEAPEGTEPDAGFEAGTGDSQEDASELPDRMEEKIIRNTGYNVSGMWTVFYLVLAGMGISIMYIKKYHLLADCDES